MSRVKSKKKSLWVFQHFIIIINFFLNVIIIIFLFLGDQIPMEVTYRRDSRIVNVQGRRRLNSRWRKNYGPSLNVSQRRRPAYRERKTQKLGRRSRSIYNGPGKKKKKIATDGYSAMCFTVSLSLSVGFFFFSRRKRKKSGLAKSTWGQQQIGRSHLPTSVVYRTAAAAESTSSFFSLALFFYFIFGFHSKVPRVFIFFFFSWSLSPSFSPLWALEK